MEKTELAEMMQARSNIYRLLDRLFRREVDETFLEVLRSIAAEDAHLPDTAAARASLRKALSSDSQDILTDFAVDFARIFLGAGIAQGTVAYPYESVYTSRDQLVMQDAYEKVLKIYRRHGITKTEADLYEDHISLELEFMAFLCDEAVAFLEKDDQASFEENLKEQRNFFKEHLANWVFNFTTTIREVAGDSIYSSAADILDGFIEEEKQLLS